MFQKDVIPALRRMTIHEIRQHHLLEVIGRIEARGSLSVAGRMRTWLRQLFEYAVVVSDMENNPVRELHVVAILPPLVRYNSFLILKALPLFLRDLACLSGKKGDVNGGLTVAVDRCAYGGLRLTTPDQFDLARGVWVLLTASLKQRNMLT